MCQECPVRTCPPPEEARTAFLFVSPAWTYGIYVPRLAPCVQGGGKHCCDIAIAWIEATSAGSCSGFSIRAVVSVSSASSSTSPSGPSVTSSGGNGGTGGNGNNGTPASMATSAAAAAAAAAAATAATACAPISATESMRSATDTMNLTKPANRCSASACAAAGAPLILSRTRAASAPASLRHQP
eukprot:scaffold6004_cov63-Phaeocystis_antarctica.AAC.2